MRAEQVAAKRQTTVRTAANQVASIFRKIGLASRAALAARLSRLYREARFSQATRLARRLGRERMGWTTLLSEMLDASIANARGDLSPVERRVAQDEASMGFDRAKLSDDQMRAIKRAGESIAPLTIGPRNAAEMTGVSWRWLRDNADRLGVPIWHVGGKSMIPAAPLLEALQREAAAREPRELSDEEERENLRHQLGMQRVPQRSAAG
jgi:hypothetical protein